MSEISVDLSAFVVQATKPKGKLARKLVERGLNVQPILEEEGNIDRFIISGRLAVEYRTASSFLNGILDKTLFTSAIYLREHFTIPVLMLEGQLDYTFRRFDPQAARGALTSMLLEYGVNVLSTRDLDETADLLVMMVRQEQQGVPVISLIPKRTATSLPDLQRRVVEMLPGCGRVLARELLHRFGSIATLVNASTSELSKIRGIGLKKARAIRQVLNADYESIDVERQIEDAIEARPTLLFNRGAMLLARQHRITGCSAVGAGSNDGDQNVVDMVFHDPLEKSVVLVELKRARLERRHCEQLRRYLDLADQSELIRYYLESGHSLRGILASPDPGDFSSSDYVIAVQRLNAAEIIRILKEQRRTLLHCSGMKHRPQ